MPSVGSAYVTVRINTKGFEAGLDKMLARLSKKMEASGKKLGDDMAKGMKSSNIEKFFRDMELRAQTASTKMRNDFKKVEGALDNVGLTASDAGDMINSSFGDTSATLRGVRNDLGDVGKEARGVEKDAGRAGSSLSSLSSSSRGVRAAGNDVGFFKSRLLSLSKEGVGVRSMLASVHDKFAILGTGASALVGGLSSVGQSLFAVGAQAAAAAPALGIFATALIGVAQVGGVLAISMHGVGEAITAGFKSVTASSAAAADANKGLGDAIAAAARAVRDAKQSLQDAYAAAARAAADAARRTIDAERQLAQSELALIQTQKDLNAAREEGLRQLRDIGFAAEDASLSEQRAALNLQDARMKLQEVSELPPDDRARIEAELAFKEAELNFREAKASRQDADRDQRESVKKGLQGTDAMVSAHNAEHDAQAQVIQNKRDLADARRNEAQVAEDNARRIRDAQQSLADAERNLAEARKQGTDATKAATTAADAYNEALKKLSPNQRKFVEALVAMGPQFKAARNQIADPLFGGLLSALNTLANSGLWGDVVDELTTTSTTLGDLIDQGADAATKPPFSTALLGAMESNNKALGPFGRAVGNLANAFVQLADASGPVLVDFANWTEKVTAAWSETATMDNRTGKLDATIQRAGDRVAVFKDFFVQLWIWLRKTGGAAVDASENFKWTKDGADQKGFIPMLTDQLKEFNDKLDHGQMVKDFHTALVNTTGAGRALKSAVIDPLLTLGRDKRLKAAFDTIGDSDAFTRLAGSGGEAAQALADLVVDVADIAATLSESGSFATFIGDLDKIASVIQGFLSVVPLPVLRGLGTVLGTLAAIRVTTTIGTKLAAALTLPGLDKLPGRVRGIAPKIAEAGSSVQTAGRDIAAGFQLSLVEGFKEVGFQGYKAAKSAFTKIKTAAGEDEGLQAGKDLMAGIALGIEAGLEGVLVASTEAGKAIIAAMKNAMGEKSPSVLTTQAGRDLMTGLTLGIEEGEAGAIAAGEQAGLATGAAVKEGAAVGGAGAGVGATGGLGAIGGAAGGEVGKVGKFAGVIGKFSKVLGPATKLLKPLSIGVRVLGAAFRFALGPVGMIVLTLLPILMPLLVKLNEKFHLTDKAMAAVKWTIDKVGDAFKWLWGQITDLFDWLKTNWPLILGILTGPIGLAVVLITKNWQKIWDTVTKFVGLVVDKVRGIWNGIVNAWHTVQRFLNGLWARHIKPWIVGLLVKVHDREWAFFHGIIDAWRNFWDWLSGLWTRHIKPWIVGLLVSLGTQELKFFHGIYEAWNVLWNWLKNLWSAHIHPWLSGFVSDFSNGISKIWQGLIDGFFSAIDWVTSKINSYLVNPINSLLGHLHVGFTIDDIPTIKGQKLKLAGGGPVDGPGTGTSDSVPAMLSRGEYVLRARAARKLGIPVLSALNDSGKLPMGDPGLFSAIGGAFSTVAGAIKDGATTAIKWVLSRAEGYFTGSDLFSQLLKGIIQSAASGAVDWVHDEEQTQLAKQGGANVAVADPDSPHSISSWHGGLFSKRFIAHLKKAQQISGSYIYVIQGGYEPTTSYSGTSHRGDAIDTRVVYSVLYALRRVGVAAGDRTGLGNWAPHIHAIPGPSAGYGAGSAVWQWQDYVARGGRRQGPKSPWGLAMGGVVHPVAGGTLVHIAEAGRAERVTPLDSEGMTPAERRILASLDAQFNNGGGGGDSYHVHPAPGMNETELADRVVRRVAWNRRRGAGRG